MACPYQDRRIPPCDFQTHPSKQNIEYCRMCGDWRDLNKIGVSKKGKFPGKTVLALMVTAIAMLFMRSFNLPQPFDSQSSDINSAQSGSSIQVPE
jgi:hypothetical protein